MPRGSAPHRFGKRRSMRYFPCPARWPTVCQERSGGLVFRAIVIATVLTFVAPPHLGLLCAAACLDSVQSENCHDTRDEDSSRFDERGPCSDLPFVASAAVREEDRGPSLPYGFFTTPFTPTPRAGAASSALEQLGQSPPPITLRSIVRRL
jgi:hypothetical protein